MRKKIIPFLALAAVCLVVAWYWYNKPREGVAGKDTELSVSAALLYEDYNADETAANKKFLNKVIEVKGTVDGIIRNGNDAVLMLGVQPGGAGISCFFSPASALGSNHVKKGMEIVVKGKCTGFNMDVNLTDCIIIL
ncbi:hypothetical protein [Agriterribacter sp.]|uniref:OB-fold protein n=1 Tax=Agriterribacter sp. TaxID=2821509 RepID=UPI002C6E8297|nr:hypothetical protein [Agriterribacter sp.]HRP55908.1 hypothetical protein [Agriterribacter sp.]